MTAGIEPAIELLQSPALPLGYVTLSGRPLGDPPIPALLEIHSGARPQKKGAEDGGRTRDLLLGKETRYHCATSARDGGTVCHHRHHTTHIELAATVKVQGVTVSASGSAHITPTPGTVRRRTGLDGSSSTFRRNLCTVTRTMSAASASS